MARKHVNSPARRMVVQALYQSEITGSDISEMENREDVIPDGGVLPEYAVSLLSCIKEHAAEIDERISLASEHWSLARMPIVDRAILRTAVCEMLFVEEVPVSVSINEAVELAKEFGGEDDSSRFVNGILGRIARSGDFGKDEACEEDAQAAAFDGPAAQALEDQAAAPEDCVEDTQAAQAAAPEEIQAEPAQAAAEAEDGQ